MLSQALAHRARRSAVLALQLLHAHVHQLATPRQQVGKFARVGISRGARDGPDRSREGAQDARIDRVGLGQFTRRAGVVAHLPWIDHRQRHRARSQLDSHSPFQPARSFHHHQRRGQACHGVAQFLQRRLVVPRVPRHVLRRRIGEHVQRAFGHVDPDKTLDQFTHTPILVKHASCTGANSPAPKQPFGLPMREIGNCAPS